MKYRFAGPLLGLGLLGAASLAATPAPRSMADPSDVAVVVTKFKQKDPGMARVFAKAYSEVVFFKTRAAFQNFKNGNLKLGAQASAIALTHRASGDLAYRDGVAIVTMAKGGLMYEASVGGQKFSFQPLGSR